MRRTVTFKNNNLKLAGNLYLPENMDSSKKYYSGPIVKTQILNF